MKLNIIGDISLKTWRLKEIELRAAQKACMRGEIEMLCLGDLVPSDFTSDPVEKQKEEEFRNMLNKYIKDTLMLEQLKKAKRRGNERN